MYRRYSVVASLLVLAGAGSAPAGEVDVKHAASLEISGYTQTRFAYRDDLGHATVHNSFFGKRSRLKLVADLHERARVQVQVDFASSRILKDAMVRLRVLDGLGVGMGPFKKPCSQEELFSSSSTPRVDRGRTHELTTATLGYSGRDQGILMTARTPGDACRARSASSPVPGRGPCPRATRSGPRRATAPSWPIVERTSPHAWPCGPIGDGTSGSRPIYRPGPWAAHTRIRSRRSGMPPGRFWPTGRMPRCIWDG